MMHELTDYPTMNRSGRKRLVWDFVPRFLKLSMQLVTSCPIPYSNGRVRTRYLPRRCLGIQGTLRIPFPGRLRHGANFGSARTDLINAFGLAERRRPVIRRWGHGGWAPESILCAHGRAASVLSAAFGNLPQRFHPGCTQENSLPSLVNNKNSDAWISRGHCSPGP